MAVPSSIALNPAAWPGLEVLKAACVIGMVLSHGFYWVWTDEGQALIPLDSVYADIFAAMMVLGFFPLTLPFIAGATFRRRRVGTDGVSYGMLGQCLLLATLGYLMNVVAAGTYALWAWNVLQLIAVSFLAIAILHARRGLWVVVVPALFVLASSDPVRAFIPAAERGAYLRVLLGDPDDWHTWPFFPWFFLVAAGYAVADAYARRHSDAMFCAVSVATGFLFTIYAAWQQVLIPVFDPENLIGPRVMQPPAAFVLGLFGVILIALGALTKFQQRWHLAPRGIIRCFSGGVLWIYLVHVCVGLRASRWLFGSVSRQQIVADPWSGWHPLVLWGSVVLLLAVSWGAGYLALQWTHAKRVHIRVRKVASAQRVPLQSSHGS